MQAGATPALLSTVLELLAEGFLVPDADLRPRAGELARSSELPDRLRKALKRLGDSPGANWAVEYAGTFLHGRPVTAHPYESFYRTGLLWDPDTCDDLAEIFELAGASPADGTQAAIDHVGLQLALLGALLAGPADRRSGSLAGRLLEVHLTYLAPRLAARMLEADPAPHFAALAAALIATVEAAAAAVGVPFDAEIPTVGAVPGRVPARSGAFADTTAGAVTQGGK